MDKIVIHGGKTLKGTVQVSGSKNAALPILFAALLTDDECIIDNVPRLADIDTTVGFLQYLGKIVERSDNRVCVRKNGSLKPSAPYELVRKMRASTLVMGPLLARLGEVRVSLPGGCAIGARPIDIHLEAFKKLGAEILIESGYVEAKAPSLTGGKVRFRYPSVGATENLLLACVYAKGKTIIENAAREPEISDLADVLNKMGAKIRGAGTSRIIVEGVSTLHGFNHSVIPDRIEAATYLIAAAITRGDITLEKVNADHLALIIDKLRKTGLSVTVQGDRIRALWERPLKSVGIKTGVYPKFPTDVQAQWMALMTLVKGKATIEETVFENRFMHAVELQRLGASLLINGNRVKVTGVERISGAPVMVSDLRAGAALVLAGLAAEGKTEVLRIYHLDRGYERLVEKLSALGSDIQRVPA